MDGITPTGSSPDDPERDDNCFDAEAAEAAFEAERLLNEEVGREVCGNLASLAGPGCPRLVPLYGRVAFVDWELIPDAFVLVNLGPSGRTARLALPNWPDLDPALAGAVRRLGGYRLMIVHPLESSSNGFEGVLFGMALQPVERVGQALTVVSCGDAYDISAARLSSTVTFLEDTPIF